MTACSSPPAPIFAVTQPAWTREKVKVIILAPFYCCNQAISPLISDGCEMAIYQPSRDEATADLWSPIRKLLTILELMLLIS